MAAASRGQPDFLRELLAVGADPNARNRDAWTALLAAVEVGNEEAVHALVESDVDINAAPWDGRTALMRAQARGDRWMISTLREKGATTIPDTIVTDLVEQVVGGPPPLATHGVRALARRAKAAEQRDGGR